MLKKYVPLLLFSMLFYSCANTSIKEQDEIRSLVEQREFSKALEVLEESSLESDKKAKLLYLMEKANLLYYKDDFFAASNVYSKANELVDSLYTKSVREKIASSILNDNSEKYYGAIFERSFLYYYQSLSFFRLAQKGSYLIKDPAKPKSDDLKKIILSDNQKRIYYDRSRSALLAWDSFFSHLRRSGGHKSFLIQDLTSKVMAAKIHELLGKRSDKEVALQLYKDARKILKRVGPAFKAFNAEFKKYNKRLKKFYSSKKKLPKLKNKDLTGQYQSSLNSINFSILKITKKLRPYDYKKIKNMLKPSKSVIAKLKKEKKTNTKIFIELGHISQLKSKEYSFNLRTAMENIKSPGTRAVVAGIGIPILTYFALGPIGLGTVSRHGNVSIYSGHNAGSALTKEVGLELYLPYVEESKYLSKYKLQIRKEKSEKVLKEVKLDYISSLNDLAFINAQEMISSSFRARSIRIGTKYVVALLAAYSTYKQMNKGSNALFAKPAAMAQFVISSKGIKETEKADARHWATLPGELLSTDLNLAPGKYRVSLVEINMSNNQVKRSINLGPLELGSNKKQSLFSYRAF